MGIYPASIKENNIIKKRTEWQEGFNAYGTELLEKWDLLESWYDSLNLDNQYLIKYLVRNDIIYLSVKKSEIYILVNLNDIFMYACSDCENVELDEISIIYDLYNKYDFDGIIAYFSIKNKIKPIKERRTTKYKNAKKYIENFK